MRIPHLALSAVLAALGMFIASTGVAATIVVTSTAADVTAGNDACTLSEAVANANTDSDTTAGDCAAGSGADEILLSGGTYFFLGLAIDSWLTLRGAGADLTEIAGGSLAVSASGDVTVVGVSTGWAVYGFFNSGVLTVRNSKLSGTPISNSGVLRLRNSSIDAWAWIGSCALSNEGTAQIVNSTLSENLRASCYPNCPLEPCDIENLGDGTVSITSSTVGLIDVSSSGETSLRNSILGDCLGAGISSLGGNIGSADCGLDDPTDLHEAPMLGPLQDNGGGTLTHAVLPGSPAIDATAPEDCTFDDDGDPQTPEVPLTEDQRGVARPRDGDADGIARCDIGAYEAGPPSCADGSDNDGDGLIDFAGGDPGCASPGDASEQSPSLVCDDGADNDTDGSIDSGDPGCTAPTDPSERDPGLVCDDGLDNDADLLVDGGDPGCSGPLDASEGTPLMPSESRCAVAQTKGGAQFCAGAFACWGRQVVKPWKDPSGARLDACLEEFQAKFASAHEQALRRADRHEQSCRLEAPVDALVEETFYGPMASIRDQVLGPWTPGNASRDENRLRSDVLGAAGDLCASRLATEGAYFEHADGARLASERTQARARFTSLVSRALEKALGKGVPDPRLDTTVIAASVEQLADGFSERLRTAP